MTGRTAGGKSQCRKYSRQPHGGRRSGGAQADRREVRCQYTVLAFDTDVGAKDWAATEWSRLRTATNARRAQVDRIERVAVLTRGLLIPPDAEAIVIGEQQGVLRDWFLHLTNYLVREAARRAPYDWSAYLPQRAETGRVVLEGHAGPRRSRADRGPADAKQTRSARAARKTSSGRRNSKRKK